MVTIVKIISQTILRRKRHILSCALTSLNCQLPIQSKGAPGFNEKPVCLTMRWLANEFLSHNKLAHGGFDPNDAAGKRVASRVLPDKPPRSSMAPATAVVNASGQLAARRASGAKAREIDMANQTASHARSQAQRQPVLLGGGDTRHKGIVIGD